MRKILILSAALACSNAHGETSTPDQSPWTTFSGSPALWFAQDKELDFALGLAKTDTRDELDGSSNSYSMDLKLLRAGVNMPGDGLSWGGSWTRYTGTLADGDVDVDFDQLAVNVAFEQKILAAIDVEGLLINIKADSYKAKSTASIFRLHGGARFGSSGVFVTYQPKSTTKQKSEFDGEQETYTSKDASSLAVSAWTGFEKFLLTGVIKNSFNDGETDGEKDEKILANERLSFRLSATKYVNEKLNLHFGLARNEPGLLNMFDFARQAPTTGIHFGGVLQGAPVKVGMFLEKQEGGIKRSHTESDAEPVTKHSVTNVIIRISKKI